MGARRDAIGLGLRRSEQAESVGKRPDRAVLKIKLMFEEKQSEFHINRKFIEKNLFTKLGGQGVRGHRAHASQEAPSAGGTDLPFSLNMPLLNLAYWANPSLYVYSMHATREIKIGLTENFFRFRLI